MAATIDMKIVRIGPYTFKVRPEDLERYLAANPVAVVVGSVQTPATSKPVVENGLITSASVSHSDQEIDQVNVILERIPDLTVAQARSIVAGGFTLATIPTAYDELVAIKGIADASAKKILRALAE